jgi:hypothetical protein
LRRSRTTSRRVSARGCRVTPTVPRRHCEEMCFALGADSSGRAVRDEKGLSKSTQLICIIIINLF